MPNRYEREIEEILRNLETTEPKHGLSQKFGERLRRKSMSRPRRRQFVFPSFGITEWLLIIAVLAALIAGGYAYAVEPNLFTGILAIVSVTCLLLVLISPFLFGSRSSLRPARSGATITPLKRGPLNSLRTRWNLFLLKLRYRRKRNH